MERRGRTTADLAVASPRGIPSVSVVTMMELLAGVARADTSQRRAKRRPFVDQIARQFDVVSFDLAAAERAAEIDALLAGAPIGKLDPMIAATALARGDAVL